MNLLTFCGVLSLVAHALCLFVRLVQLYNTPNTPNTPILQVVVFSKSYCPYCEKTKALFADLGVDIKVHELDLMGDDGPPLQMALLDMTGQKSVPNVFVKGKHIGGNDDTQAAAQSGALQEALGL